MLNGALHIDLQLRRAALDLRLYDRFLPDFPESKVNRAVREIARVWHETAARRSAQLVFCDLSTPTAGRDFSVYEDMHAKLFAQGVPASEMAFIQDFDSDAAKLELFRNVNAGRVRILFGSTQKMGAGMNAQERLIALHHLDAPWRPADVEQREGRILRQGNRNPEVQIFRYVTEESFDAYMWQTLETKARFIAQVMTGESNLRCIEDVDGAALTYAEVKAIASGNPMVIEKANVDAEVVRLTRLQSQHGTLQFNLRQRLRHSQEDVPRMIRRLEALRQDLGIRQDTSGERFVIQIGGQEYRDRGLAGELILRRATALRGMGTERAIGNIAGFQLCVVNTPMGEAQALLRGAGTYVAKVTDTALGTIRSVEHMLQNLEQTLAEGEQHLADTEKRITDLTGQIGQPFEYAERLAALRRRQQELTEALDLTKNQASAQLGSDAGPAVAVAEPDSDTLKECREGDWF